MVIEPTFNKQYRVSKDSPLNPNRVGFYAISGDEVLKPVEGFAILSTINHKDETVFFSAEEKFLEDVL